MNDLSGYEAVAVLIHELEKLLNLRLLAHKLFQGQPAIKVSVHGLKELVHLFSGKFKLMIMLIIIQLGVHNPYWVTVAPDFRRTSLHS